MLPTVPHDPDPGIRHGAVEALWPAMRVRDGEDRVRHPILGEHGIDLPLENQPCEEQVLPMAEVAGRVSGELPPSRFFLSGVGDRKDTYRGPSRSRQTRVAPTVPRDT